MNSIESAFIPYQPQKMSSGEKQSFFFVTYTGDPVSKNKAARKTIRAQASRASASQRIETTAIRRGAKRCQSTSPSKRQRFAAPRLRKPLMDIVSDLPSEPLCLPALPMQLAVQPHNTVTDDWECGIPWLIRDHFVKAVLELRRRQIGCDLHTLSLYFTDPMLYNDPLMLQCLELLAVTAFNVPSSRPIVSRPVIIWLWQRVFLNIQAAMSMNDSTWFLAPTLALLAAWELGFGDAQTCEYHLRALSKLCYGDCDPNYTTGLPEQAFILCLPTRDHPQQPLGFQFFQDQFLQPQCLMNMLGSLSSHCDPSNPLEVANIRRVGIAAMSCQPSSSIAIHSMKLNDVKHRIAVHVRLAAAILSAMVQVDFEQTPLDPTNDPMKVWYPETRMLDSETLAGTVHDEILLWSVCVFACASFEQQLPPHQRPLVERLVLNRGFQTWNDLEMVLDRYFWPTNLTWRLRCSLHGLLIP